MNKQSNSVRPKIGYAVAFEQGYEILQFVLQQQGNINFVATCSQDESEYHQRIVDLCKINNVPTFHNIDGNDEEFATFLVNENIDVVVLAWWPTIIKRKAIRSANVGWINLHPSLLPYGRGKHGYFWAIAEDTPFGVSIHFIDDGVDTGPVLFQKEIDVTFVDTGQSLYDKGVLEVIKLFKENYHRIERLDFQPIKQDDYIATSHFASEIEERAKIDLNKKYYALDLINLIRAKTFWTGPSLRMTKSGTDYYLRMEIEEVERD
jgi:methionyl-tRNA formyltransferase